MSLVSISCFVCSLFSPRRSSLLSRFISLSLLVLSCTCTLAWGPCGARGRKTGRLLARARKINQDRARIENAIYDRDCYPRPLCLSVREARETNAHEPLPTDPPRDYQIPRVTKRCGPRSVICTPPAVWCSFLARNTCSLGRWGGVGSHCFSAFRVIQSRQRGNAHDFLFSSLGSIWFLTYKADDKHDLGL